MQKDRNMMMVMIMKRTKMRHGKSKEKTDGWSKAREKNEQFAFVLESKEDGVECT